MDQQTLLYNCKVEWRNSTCFFVVVFFTSYQLPLSQYFVEKPGGLRLGVNTYFSLKVGMISSFLLSYECLHVGECGCTEVAPV